MSSLCCDTIELYLLGFSTIVWCVQIPKGALLVSGVVQFGVWCVEDRGKVAGGPDKREV